MMKNLSFLIVKNVVCSKKENVREIKRELTKNALIEIFSKELNLHFCVDDILIYKDNLGKPCVSFADNGDGSLLKAEVSNVEISYSDEKNVIAIFLIICKK